MKYLRSATVCVALCLLAWAQPGFGQTVTAGSIAGTGVHQQGGVLPGGSLTAVHQPPGTSYEAVTGSDGRFTFQNVRVGAPYQVTATLAGFRDQQLGNVQVAL